MRNLLRLLKDRLFTLFAVMAGGLVLCLFAAGFFGVAFKGMDAVSWEFLFTPMREGGKEGGILYQMAGTGILVLTALAVVIPLSYGLAILRVVYCETNMMKKMAALFLHVLNGIPSILFGIFGFFLFVKWLGWDKSWLAGGILLAMMILPTTALALTEGMVRIPAEYSENAFVLGLSRSAVVRSVLIPQSLSSFASGLLLGLARAAGETAPIMFTATVFSGAAWPAGIADSPVLSLPYHIFNLAQESYPPELIGRAWATALVLILLAAGLSLAALPFRIRFHEEAR